MGREAAGHGRADPEAHARNQGWDRQRTSNISIPPSDPRQGVSIRGTPAPPAGRLNAAPAPTPRPSPPGRRRRSTARTSSGDRRGQPRCTAARRRGSPWARAGSPRRGRGPSRSGRRHSSTRTVTEWLSRPGSSGANLPLPGLPGGAGPGLADHGRPVPNSSWARWSPARQRSLEPERPAQPSAAPRPTSS